MKTAPPFFIVGCSRSGTTLLQVLLDAHPHIAIPPESLIFAHFAEIFDCYGDLKKESNLRALVKDVLTDERIKRWDLKISVSDFCGRLEDFSVRGVVTLLFQCYAEKEGKVRWGDKTPEHVYYLKKIKTLFPEAKLIHLVRDGRDVAESQMRVFFGPNTIDQAALSWKKHVSAFRRFSAHLRPDEYREIHYEDLVRSPDQELKKIFDFLGEEFLSFSERIPETTSKAHYLQYDAIHTSLKKSISGEKIGIFKSKLSRRQVEIFESIAGNLLESYGYARVTPVNRPILAYEKIIYGVLDQFFRFQLKMGKWSYLKERIQYHMRRWIRLRMRREKRHV